MKKSNNFQTFNPAIATPKKIYLLLLYLEALVICERALLIYGMNKEFVGVYGF